MKKEMLILYYCRLAIEPMTCKISKFYDIQLSLF